uniref:replicative DNA helicase n=1 Tax=Nocardiopsis ganjiahuensis TaxID=239984 RepID=UPI000347C897|nr:DnaB-like helicase C-terminal domain-containing protein [Nocardiopsis ganjiahuensis]
MTDPPHPAVQVERAVLGATLLSKDSIEAAAHIMGAGPECFSEPAHQLIYASVMRLYERGEPVDAIAVHNDLIAREESEQAGGAIYLHELTEAADTKNVERNARQVIFTPAPIASEHAQWMFDALPGYLDLLEGTRKAPRPNALTGFQDLDKLTTGLEPGTLTVISGRPSAGKSTLLGNIACSSALRHAVPTMWIDQESSHRQVLDRIFSAEARVPLHVMRIRTMTDADWARLAVAMGRVASSPLLLQAGRRVDILQVRQLAEESGAELVAVDGLQSLKPRRDRETREREVSDITRALKDLALELNVPVVATAHLNRAPLQRFDPSPTLDDLRESDLIAHLADTVILIDRPDMRDPESPRAGEADLMVVKHRNGFPRDVTVAFQGHYSRFVDMAPG